MPEYVEDELRGYLTCGILCFGFARGRCTGCGQAFVVAFSCKGRGVCPSCDGRHMAQTAAHLADPIIPPGPVTPRPPPTCSSGRTAGFQSTRVFGSRLSTAMCPARTTRRESRGRNSLPG